MRIIYTAPEIKIEELEKQDVLCSSGVDPNSFDNVVSGNKGNGRNDITSLRNIL